MSVNKYDFSELNELASAMNGGKVLFATDEWFAAADNLLKDDEPLWREGLYTDFGKWMDGWETRRKRCPGHDWAIISLKYSSIIKGICVDTAYFTGNYPPRVSIQAACLDEYESEAFPPRTVCHKAGVAASKEGLKYMEALKTDKWTTIVQMSKLNAGYEKTRKNYFYASNFNQPWTHLRLNLYPDGGVARLRVYGLVCPSLNSLSEPLSQLIDLVARENGGVCEKYSNAHYGHPRNLIKNEDGIGMYDGWETARRLDRPAIIEVDDSGILQIPGDEWAIFKLGYPGLVDRIVIDTKHFHGNFPDSAQIEGIYLDSNDYIEKFNNKSDDNWHTILPRNKLSPNKSHVYASSDLLWYGPVTHIRITISPDGGLSRLRIWGYVNVKNSKNLENCQLNGSTVLIH